jgi:hypothetical protein
MTMPIYFLLEPLFLTEKPRHVCRLRDIPMGYPL